jgi:hypothetical protein
MPYIAPQQRQTLNPLIDQLARQIAHEALALDYDGACAGLLNYVCTHLALKVVRQQFGPMRYWLIALLTGTFKNIADEFYRRIAIPYENQQMAKSGDVDLYEEYDLEIENP